MRRSLTSIAAVTVLLIGLGGTPVIPVAAQGSSIDTVVSNGSPDEIANETTVTLPTGDTVDITIKAENASAAAVDIERNTTTNTVTVTVDANGDGTVDGTGVVQAGDSARLDVDTNTDVPMSLRLTLRPTV